MTESEKVIVVIAARNNLLDEFRKEKFLSWDMERGLYAQWRGGNPDARQRLIRGHLPYVAIVASKYKGHPLFDDLIQSSIICVIKEVDSPKYDPSKYRLQSYLLHRIRQRIYRELRANRLIPVPRQRIQHKTVAEKPQNPWQPPVKISGGWQGVCHHCGKTIIRMGRLSAKRLDHPWYCCPKCYSVSGARAKNTRAARAKTRQENQAVREALQRDYSSFDTEEGPLDVPDRTGGNPARLVAEREESNRLWGLVKSLPDYYAKTLRMRYLDGSSFAEISESLHVSVGAVKHYHERALKLLRTCMEQ